MLYNYSGVMHIHTKYSDGSSDIKGVAKAAAKAGASFVLINDHDTLKALELEGENYFNGVLVLIGMEVTPKRNHFLCYDIETIPSKELHPNEYVGQVYEQGGFGFLAHPDQKENPIFPGRMNWDNWDIEQPFGVEIWNYFAQWMGGFRSFPGLLKSFLFPKFMLKAPQKETLRMWDNLGRHRPIAAIAGVDAHGGRQLTWIPNILSSYIYQFKTLRTHVLTKRPLEGNLQKDRVSILSALKKGRCYLVNHLVGPVEQFGFSLQHLGNTWYMGEEAKYSDGMVLNIKVPGIAHIRVIKNGNLFSKCTTNSLRLINPGPGVYRVEVYKGNIWPRPWIFSNHIYIRQ